MNTKYEIDESKAVKQYGIIFPNRSEAWGEEAAYKFSGPSVTLETEAGRSAAQAEYQQRVERMGLDWDDAFALKFVSRTATLAYTNVSEED